MATGYLLAPLKVDLVVYLEVTPIRTLDAIPADAGAGVATELLSAIAAPSSREVEVPPGRERWRPRGVPWRSGCRRGESPTTRGARS